MISKRKGQSTMEYALIVAVVAAALVAMNIYMKRGMENRLRRSTDDIAKQFDANRTTISRTVNRSGGQTLEFIGNNGTTDVKSGYDPGVENGTGTKTKITASENIAGWQ